MGIYPWVFETFLEVFVRCSQGVIGSNATK